MQLTIDIVTLISGVVGFGIAIGGVVASLYKMLDNRLRPIVDGQQATNTALVELKVALVGIDGQNGLRSDVRKLAGRVDALEESMP